MNKNNIQSRINNDYDQYIQEGNIVIFDKMSILNNDVLEIKDALIDKMNDHLTSDDLKTFYQNTNKNIITELSKFFLKAYQDNDIQGYYDNHIDYQEIGDAIDVYFEING